MEAEKDSVVLVVGRWKGQEQIWREGVFDDQDAAWGSWCAYINQFVGGMQAPEFVRFLAVTP